MLSRMPPLLLAAAVITGCAASQIALEPRADAVVATNIKARLVDDVGVDAAAIATGP